MTAATSTVVKEGRIVAEDIAVHPAPAWRDREDFIIRAALDDVGLPRKGEQLWAERVAPRRFDICCIPFFVYNLAIGDEVETRPQGGVEYVGSKRVRSGGHHTYRAWFGGAPTESVRTSVARELVQAGATIEWSSDDLLAVDAASGAIAEQVVGLLFAHHQAGSLIYEDAFITPQHAQAE